LIKWGLGIGDWGLGPIPNPPIPNPQYLYDLNNLYIYMISIRLYTNKTTINLKL